MICYTNKWQIPFQIDDDDYEVVSRYSWCIVEGYPATNIPVSKDLRPKGQKTVRLHLLLLGKALEGFEWDHLDQDKLNNCRQNLRLATSQMNRRNRGLRIDNISGITGVWKEKNRWRAAIQGYDSVHLGCFSTFEEAVKARLDYEKTLSGYVSS